MEDMVRISSNQGMEFLGVLLGKMYRGENEYRLGRV
jgi:hypothetical protein